MEKIFKDMAVKEAALKNVDTENTKVMVHVQEMTNVLRQDKREQPPSQHSCYRLRRGRHKDKSGEPHKAHA